MEKSICAYLNYSIILLYIYINFTCKEQICSLSVPCTSFKGRINVLDLYG